MAGAGAPPPIGRCRETRWTQFYLHADRGLGDCRADGARAPLDYVSDPRHPVPTIGGAISSGEPVMRGGAYDQREGPRVRRRALPPLAERRRAGLLDAAARRATSRSTGPVTVQLWIASDAPDTDFTAKLIDVHPPSADYPDGFAMNLTEGFLRVRYRDSWEQPSPMMPGEVYAITIELFPTGNLFRRGHRLRLDIASSNFPHFDVNPNSGEPEGAWIIRAWPATASLRLPSAPRTSCCRSSRRRQSPTGGYRTAA